MVARNAAKFMDRLLNLAPLCYLQQFRFRKAAGPGLATLTDLRTMRVASVVPLQIPEHEVPGCVSVLEPETERVHARV